MNISFSDHELRLMEMSGHYAVAVDRARVNIDDLVNMKPGRIIRCIGDPNTAIKVFMTQDDSVIGCVAGWMSEEA